MKKYHGFALYKCWCGHPTMMWIAYFGFTPVAVCKTLKEVKQAVDKTIASDKDIQRILQRR